MKNSASIIMNMKHDIFQEWELRPTSLLSLCSSMQIWAADADIILQMVFIGLHIHRCQCFLEGETLLLRHFFTFARWENWGIWPNIFPFTGKKNRPWESFLLSLFCGPRLASENAQPFFPYLLLRKPDQYLSGILTLWRKLASKSFSQDFLLIIRQDEGTSMICDNLWENSHSWN